MNCGPLSEMIRAQAALQDDLDVRLGHGLAQLPVYDGARATVEQRAEIEETSTCQCSWGASGCTKPLPLSEGFGFEESSRPALLRTR